MIRRRSALVVFCLFVATLALGSDAPAAGDRDALVAQLKRTEERFLKSVEGLSEAQWNFKPAPDRWSIAECAEHITAAEPFLRAMIAEAAKTTLTTEQRAKSNQDQFILTALVDRSKKFKAPEPLIPTNRFGTPAAAMEAFRKERAQTIALAATDVDLRAQGSVHPFLGPLDVYGWLLFQSGHTERHTLQIEEVKADPNFPKQ